MALISMLRRFSAGIRVATAAVALAVLGSAVPAAAPALTRLKGIDELKAWFNANDGHPRVVFLLSPT